MAMTKMANGDVQCCSCQYTWIRAIYVAANVTRNPGLKARIISGDLFSVRCPSCGHWSQAQHDCLYHDLQKRLLIKLTSATTLSEAERDAYLLRIVHSVHELREKISIFDAHLNDGIVELCKAVLAGKDPELRDASLRFQFVDDVGQLTFSVIRPGRQPRNVSVPRAYYDAARTKSFSELAAFAEARGTWLRVDSETVGPHLLARKAS